MKAIIIKAGREKSALRRHPWLFSGAVSEVQGKPEPGEAAEVYADDGTFLGMAAYSPASQIRARFWTFGERATIGKKFLEDKIASCLLKRQARGFDLGDKASAFRLVFSESDGIPGCIVDKYGEYLSVEILAAGPERLREELFEVLAEQTGCKGIYERSDSEVRRKEGLELRSGVAYGSVPETPVEIVENGLKFLVDIRNGHKTGCYLDQRDARKRIGELALGKRVLNCFCYTGGFGLYALRGGAEHVYQVDVSKGALKIAKQLVTLNGLPTAKITHTEADVFSYLRKCRDRAETYDLIVLDPPKFIEAKDHLAKGSRGYKDINLLALKLLSPGGMLATFSCSGLVDMALFQKIVADACSDSGREVQIIGRFGQPADHPVALSFPEGQYLKGLLLQAD